MADLVPRHQLAEITTLLGAPYVNSFGATETGLPPATAALIPIGEAPTDLAKRQSAFCEVRLVDADDRDVPDGAPGECAIRGPTLFSGYWRAPEVNAKDFRGGWFHMGDVFIRRDDGRLDFVDRAKYLIKSGGENVYPAEIERVLLADPRVGDAVVVRRPDAKWGEVPVAVVARNDQSLTADELSRQMPPRARRLQAAQGHPLRRVRRPAAQHHRQDPAPRGRGLAATGRRGWRAPLRAEVTPSVSVFILEAFEPHGRWVMVRNPSWWGATEYDHNIDRIVSSSTIVGTSTAPLSNTASARSAWSGSSSTR